MAIRKRLRKSEKICRALRFTHRSVASLVGPPPDSSSSNIEYTDTVEACLRIAVYKSSRRTFRARLTINHQKVFITIGPFPAVSPEKAREIIRGFKAMIAEGLDPREEREKIQTAPTLEEYAMKNYLPFARKERRSYPDIESRIKSRIIPAFGKKKLPNITKREISEFHIRLRQISAATANRYLAIISSMFNKALEWGMATENPARGIKKFKENGPRKRVLSSDELGRFMKALKDEMDSPSGKAIFLLIALGLRKMEVLSLAWSNVDLSRKSLFLPQTKSGVPRYVVINSQALEVLREMQSNRRRDCDWVFPSDSKTGHLHEVRRTFDSILKKAEISNFRLHDLRRSFASTLVNQGVSILQVRDLLGHSDVKTTQIYAHLGTASLEAASETVAAELERALSQV